MSPCHNLEPSLVARDSSRLLSVKPNEWMHLSPFYTRMHGEWLRYAKSTSQFHWRFLLVRDVRGFQVNPLCRHDITSPLPPSGNGGYVRNLDDSGAHSKLPQPSQEEETLMCLLQHCITALFEPNINISYAFIKKILSRSKCKRFFFLVSVISPRKPLKPLKLGGGG